MSELAQSSQTTRKSEQEVFYIAMAAWDTIQQKIFDKEQALEVFGLKYSDLEKYYDEWYAAYSRNPYSEEEPEEFSEFDDFDDDLHWPKLK